MQDLAKALREKAAGQRNECGDVWGDWLCLVAALRIKRHAAGLAARDAETREKALREAAEVARNACLVPPDGGSPTEAEVAVCDAAAAAILALIPQPQEDRTDA